MKTKQAIVLLYVSVIFLVSVLLFLSIHWLLSISAWLLIIGISFSKFVIYVPEVTGWVTHNKFSGKVIGYGSGYHIKYPWEKIADSISLKVVTNQFTKYYDAEDGPEMKFSCTYSYKPSENRLEQFIKVDKSTIESAILGGISTIASRFVSQKEAIEARGAVEEAGKEILTNFEDKTKVQTTEGDKGIEKAFGINVVMIRIDDIEYPESFRKARAASAQAKEMVDAAKTYKLDETVTGKDALNFILVQEGKADKKIIDLEGIDTTTLGKFFSKLVKH